MCLSAMLEVSVYTVHSIVEPNCIPKNLDETVRLLPWSRLALPNLGRTQIILTEIVRGFPLTPDYAGIVS
jgi:hypothetical protein